VATQSFEKWLISQQSLGSWKLDHKLGNGVFGIVFSAKKLNINGKEQTAAIKVISPLAHQNVQQRKLFQHEFDVLSKIDSPYVPKVLDSGVANFQSGADNLDLLWFAMEEIKGGDLEEELDTHGSLEQAEWLELAHDLFAGIAAAHSSGVIHKDIKPGNIARFSRRSILLDFGGASFVDIDDPADEMSLSTVAFSAPEQQDGTSPYSLQYPVDLFAAGVTLVQAATGELPWANPTNSEVATFKKQNPQLPRDIPSRDVSFLAFAVKKRLTPPKLDHLSSVQKSIILPLLKINPSERGTAQDMLKKIQKELPNGSSRKTDRVSVGRSPRGFEKPQKVVEPNPLKGSKPPKEPRVVTAPQRQYVLTWFFSVLLGWLGVDRFYLAKFFTGALKLLTFGGAGIWSLVDLLILVNGGTRDRWSRELVDENDNRKELSKWTFLACVITVALSVIWVIIGQTSDPK
jgi:serine/threonine protein kinase